MSDVTDPLEWLERWYRAQCDGEWEHQCGVTIDTLDNPGWSVTIDLKGAESGSTSPRTLAVVGEPPSGENGNEGGPIWMTCEIKGGKFVGAGDPTQLRAILEQFRRVTAADPT